MTYSKDLHQFAQRNHAETVKAVAEAMKQRDPREPGRRAKLRHERQMSVLWMRIFGKQSRATRAWLKEQYPDRKATTYPPVDIFMLDPRDEAALIRLLIEAMQGGILLFGASAGLELDYTLINMAAAEWARAYAGMLVKDVTSTSLQAIQRAVSLFVETPGMTIGDVMNMLPYTESRSHRIAVTEITRAYAEANKLAGEELQRQFPGVKIVKTWFTNRDDLVCIICGPLDGMQIDFNAKFPGDLDRPPAHVNCRCWDSVTTKVT